MMISTRKDSLIDTRERRIGLRTMTMSTEKGRHGILYKNVAKIENSSRKSGKDVI